MTENLDETYDRLFSQIEVMIARADELFAKADEVISAAEEEANRLKQEATIIKREAQSLKPYMDFCKKLMDLHKQSEFVSNEILTKDQVREVLDDLEEQESPDFKSAREFLDLNTSKDVQDSDPKSPPISASG